MNTLAQGMKTLLTLYPYFIVSLFYAVVDSAIQCCMIKSIFSFCKLSWWVREARSLAPSCQSTTAMSSSGALYSTVRGWILGRNWNKSLKSFSPCYSQSPLLTEFYPPPPPSKSGLKLVCCNVNFVYGNLKSENFQDFAQKPQQNCTFMNLASWAKLYLYLRLISFAKFTVCFPERFLLFHSFWRATKYFSTCFHEKPWLFHRDLNCVIIFGNK